MSVTFTKLFSSITSSTIWVADPETKVVWITMLAMADKRGRVWASIPGLAKDAVVSVEATRRAITSFLSPDPDSRTKDHDGRRIEEIDGGWRLINYEKYRAIRDEESRREYKTAKQQEYRHKTVDIRGQCGHSMSTVDTDGHIAEADSRQQIAEAQAQVTNPLAYSDKSLPAETTVFDLPILGNKVYEVPRRLYDGYVQAYPGISVMAELNKMNSWLLSNPKNQKTTGGMSRFINNWLAKAQNNAPTERKNNAANISAAEQRQQRSHDAITTAAEFLERGGGINGSGKGEFPISGTDRANCNSLAGRVV